MIGGYTTPFSPLARTTTQNSGAISCLGNARCRFYLTVSAVAGILPVLNIKVQTYDPQLGSGIAGMVDIPGANFGSISGLVTTQLVVDPAVTPVLNQSVDLPMGGQYNLVAAISGVGASFTFSVTAEHYD